MRRVVWVLLALLAACGVAVSAVLFDKNKPEIHADPVEHFKYGSIGTEERAGVPYFIWSVLPDVFPEYLPDRPGKGYERAGFLYEDESKTRPVGTTYRVRQVAMVGLNCASCHSGVIRDTPDGPPRIIPGMPAHQFDLQAYLNFLTACAQDERFNAAVLLPAIKKKHPEFGFMDELVHRLIVIEETKKLVLEQGESFSWMDSRPRQGPGRVDTFNPYKAYFGFDLEEDQSVGTADFPPLFMQEPREGLRLHWDGNNDSVDERNKSAAIGAGCSEDSLDLAAIKRVRDWIWTLPPPDYPMPVDEIKLAAGKDLYAKHCAECHAFGGAKTGTVEDQAVLKTDPERLRSFSAELSAKMNTLGTGRPWKFSRFRPTNGYANMPLDGVWLRAPYLHNGSVPTLRDLLAAPEDRPTVFYRGYDVYDYDNVGFVSSGPEAESAGFKFDTMLRGNSNSGHVYGVELDTAEKDALIEYMKTL